MMGRSALSCARSFRRGPAGSGADARAPNAGCARRPRRDRSPIRDSPPMELEVQAILDFDRIVVLGGGEGTATLRPDGTRHVTGSFRRISGRAMVGEARVRGEPGRTVRVDMPARIELHSVSGATISIDEIVTDLAARCRGSIRLAASSFRFGGRLRLSGQQRRRLSRRPADHRRISLNSHPKRTKIFPLR